MLYLLTSNPRKYEPCAELLAQLQIILRVPEFELPELQDEDFLAVLGGKARLAAEALGAPCLVDDSGLLLDAYPGFPGPFTRAICKHLGADGLERLLSNATNRARMVCHLGCWVDGKLWHWQGEAAGHVDPRRPVGAGAGPLTAWFVPDEPVQAGEYPHRRKALEALGRDIDKLRQTIAPDSSTAVCTNILFNSACVFCQEFDGEDSSVYHELLGTKLPSRLVHKTEHFLVFPPLGEFVEGGLLITTREHHISMGHLPDDHYGELERLVAETCELLNVHYGCRPLFFEHAPVSPGDKGTCCVDHAHLNVFPVRVDVHEHLRKKFPNISIGGLCQLRALGEKNQAYLFLQTNVGTRFVYDAGIVPTQYVRRIITTELGMPERWHWRDYLGLEELEQTFATLRGWRNSDASAR